MPAEYSAGSCASAAYLAPMLVIKN